MEKQYYKLDTDDNPIYRTILHHAITATGSIAKGFSFTFTFSFLIIFFF